MAATNTFRRRVFSAVVFCLFSLLVLSANAYALISEPDHIVYGIFPPTNNEISLQINGEIVTTYTRGENSAAGDYFILRVPLDSQEPPLPDTFRPGLQGELFLDTETTPEQVVTLGQRGTTQRIFLDGTPVDSDLDGILDGEDNCPDTPNYSQYDANNDGEGNACDGNSDTDRDGYVDMQEFMNFHAGILDPLGYAFNPTFVNAPGGEGYSGLHPLKMLIPILMIIMEEDE